MGHSAPERSALVSYPAPSSTSFPPIAPTTHRAVSTNPYQNMWNWNYDWMSSTDYMWPVNHLGPAIGQIDHFEQRPTQLSMGGANLDSNSSPLGYSGYTTFGHSNQEGYGN